MLDKDESLICGTYQCRPYSSNFPRSKSWDQFCEILIKS